MKKSKKKNEGVAAKPRRQGDGKEEGKEEKKRKKKKEKRNAGSSPAPSAALQAAPARETTFRVWPAGWRSSRTKVEDVWRVVG